MSKPMPPEQAKDGPSHANVLVSAIQRTERAAGDFRRGMPVVIAAEGDESAIALAAETATDVALNQLAQAFGAPTLVLTPARAQTLKIPLYTPDVVAIALPHDARAEGVRAVADPSSDLAHPMKGPFAALRGPLPEAAAPSVQLAKLAGLLPAALLYRADAPPRDLSRAAASDIAHFHDQSARTLAIITRAHVPLEGAKDAELVAFRPANGGPEHYALVIGQPTPPVLARIHSECFTGDLLGSLRCDCGEQLRGAIAAIAKAGGGVVLYLAQEGRGIGLNNKLRAYRLQDEGFDTFEANRRLGFEADERYYDIAVRMLALLGISSVRLMTNNPLKVKALEGAGITVTERVPLVIPATGHDAAYLRAKKDSGHLL
jgi:GTP cyclohydrolase II